MNVRPPPKQIFFAPLAIELSPDDLERVQFAYAVSKYGHRKQVRDSGKRYFDHPKSAAWIYIHELGGRDVRVIIDLLLHDLVEDAFLLTLYRIALNFGPEVAYDIRGLTKLEKDQETIVQYLERVIACGWETIVAKLCDRLHNLRTSAACTPDKRAKMIAETKEYHLPMLTAALNETGGKGPKLAEALEGLIWEAISDAEKM